MQDVRFSEIGNFVDGAGKHTNTYIHTHIHKSRGLAVSLIAQYVVTSCAVFSSLLRPVREKCVP